MAFLNKGRSKLTTKPARSVKRITKSKAPVKKPGIRGNQSALKSPANVAKQIAKAKSGISFKTKAAVKTKAPKAPTSPRKPPAPKLLLKDPKGGGRGGRENSGQAVARKTTKPVKNRTSVKVSQRSKKIK